jgi:hypothetical protein
MTTKVAVRHQMVKDKMYWLGTGKILSFLNRFLHKHLGPVPDIILITLFCCLNTCCACAEFPPKIIPHWKTGWKYAKYTICKISVFRVWVTFLIVKHATLSLWGIWLCWGKQGKHMECCCGSTHPGRPKKNVRQWHCNEFQQDALWILKKMEVAQGWFSGRIWHQWNITFRSL